MSTTYNTTTGDTFALISRKRYGTPDGASRISAANPGVSEPLIAGTQLVIPPQPDAPKNVAQVAPSSNTSECALKIDGNRFRFWTTLRVVRSIGAIDIVEFTAPFDPTVRAQRDAFRPMTFKEVEVTVDGERLFLGTMLTPSPELTPNSSTMHVSAYAKPGVLADCTIPAGTFYPQNEILGETLEGIAKLYADPFGIEVKFEQANSVGAAFPQVAITTTKKILTFLADLAKQRNLVIGSTVDGALEFRKGTDQLFPQARLEQGASPVLEVVPNFSPQEYYSSITGLEPVIVGGAGSVHTVRNPHLPGVVRPLTFKVNDAIGGDVPTATNANMGRMFGNAATYSVTVDTWRDEDGFLWEPNITVELLAPGAMVYTPYKFLIRSVTFTRDATEERATLDLVMPGSFSGKIPDSLPWDE